MKTVLPTTVARTPDVSLVTPSPSKNLKPQRVYACMLCQQRKVKCDRKYPCAYCIKSRTQCVQPVQVSRRRRRRFPERELLERLRKYEDLLRQNNIKFEPFHKDSTGEKGSPTVEGGYDSDDEQLNVAGPGASSPSTTANSERVHEARNIWHGMRQEVRSPKTNNSDSSEDDMRAIVIKKAWDQLFHTNDNLLFGPRKSTVDVYTLHPDPVQIFRLWQLYLENVNPLLKVTHTPSLQGRIIEAATNVFNIKPDLEALMFSIYCMSVLSLSVDDCQAIFGSSKADLLTRYQFGCQQALLNCGFLRSGDRDCLTALYLYIFSVRPNTVPQSLSSMLGVAIRIAQRMGIHSESALSKCTALEAEMRRRLWWSLVIFDTRIGEMADSKTATLTPMWDCRIPLNVNDSDLRPEMKALPQLQGKITEALFTVVRSELGDYIRHTMFHLIFSGPSLKPVAEDVQNDGFHEGCGLIELEGKIEAEYLKYCDSENPLHFLTIWMTRAYLAKCRLVEHYLRFPKTSVSQAAEQHDAAISYALSMLECDTKIMTSPLAKGFLWLLDLYFPFAAYIQILQNLKRRPLGDQADPAWETMSDNFEARFGRLGTADNPFFQIFAKIVLQAWEAHEATFRQSQESLTTPKIVISIRQKMAQQALHLSNSDTKQTNGAADIGVNNFSVSTLSMGAGSHSLLDSMEVQDGYAVPGPGAYPTIPGLDPQGVNVDQFDWYAMDWDLLNAPTSETGGSPVVSLL
ncbi:hypothetical protein MMC26_003902 [Xylographa opegraphella]|nr:hypothetical protein [Xylographa opegraphella]